jgi:hypothetical protein
MTLEADGGHTLHYLLPPFFKKYHVWSCYDVLGEILMFRVGLISVFDMIICAISRPSLCLNES